MEDDLDAQYSDEDDSEFVGSEEDEVDEEDEAEQDFYMEDREDELDAQRKGRRCPECRRGGLQQQTLPCCSAVAAGLGLGRGKIPLSSSPPQLVVSKLNFFERS